MSNQESDIVNSCSAVILAGGNSSRMGFPKPWLLKGNKTFLSAIVQDYRDAGIANLVVVLNEKYANYEWIHELEEVKQYAEVIINNAPNKGRLYSLYLGLKSISTSPIFIHNVDNPFVEKEVLLELCKAYDRDFDVIIPSFRKKGGHPILISAKIKEEIVINYDHYESLKTILSKFSKQYVQVGTKSILSNINTPEELDKAQYELN
jgi:molybdenum cofactor cytidylyltransferase